MLYFITLYGTYRDQEHQEAGFRIKTSYATYTVNITADRVTIHPRNEAPFSFELEEVYAPLLPHPHSLAILAILQHEVELFGEPS